MTDKEYVSIRGPKQRQALLGKRIRFSYRFGSTRTGVVDSIHAGHFEINGQMIHYSDMKNVEIVEDQA